MQINNEHLKCLGKHIKTLRKGKKLTLSALCYKNGMEPSTLSRIEAGLVDPKYLTLLKIAESLDTNLSKLLDF